MSRTKRQTIKAGAVFAVLYGISTLLGSTLQDKGYLCRPEPRTVTLSVAEGLIAFFLFVIVIGNSHHRLFPFCHCHRGQPDALCRGGRKRTAAGDAGTPRAEILRTAKRERGAVAAFHDR